MSGFFDIHSHFLYGVDDGSRTAEEMQAMLDAAYENGIRSIMATPHVTPGIHPVDEDKIALHLEQARAYCREKGYDMQLFSGAEILYSPAMERFIEERKLPALAGSESVLVEFSPDVAMDELDRAVEHMDRAGYTVILAHIERYLCLCRGKAAWQFRERHPRVQYQVNGRTLINPHGFFQKKLIKAWLKDRLIHFVGSDAHRTDWRRFCMREAYESLLTLTDEDYAKRLVGLQ